MTDRRDERAGGVDDRVRTTESPDTMASPIAHEPGIYRPSSAFRRALRRATPGHASGVEGRSAESEPRSTPEVSRTPGLTPLIGAALAVGVAAGFLELAVVMIQVQGLHRVGLATLRISRHVAWMVPVAEVVVTLGLTLGLVTPALALSALRRRRTRSSGSSSWCWWWAGTVLGTLLLLGPLLAVRCLHGGAALALAFGAGTRIGRLLVRPTPGWRRASRLAGVAAFCGLVAYSAWQWDRVARAE